MVVQDENLLRAIYANNTNGTELRIVDCRSRMAALGNQLALGAGVESRQNGYETCQIEHQVRLTILTTCRRRFCCCWVAFS